MDEQHFTPKIANRGKRKTLVGKSAHTSPKRKEFIKSCATFSHISHITANGSSQKLHLSSFISTNYTQLTHFTCSLSLTELRLGALLLKYAAFYMLRTSEGQITECGWRRDRVLPRVGNLRHISSTRVNADGAPTIMSCLALSFSLFSERFRHTQTHKHTYVEQHRECCPLVAHRRLPCRTHNVSAARRNSPLDSWLRNNSSALHRSLRLHPLSQGRIGFTLLCVCMCEGGGSGNS